MKSLSLPALAVAAAIVSSAVNATGLATCNSGDPKTWQSQDKLRAQLVSQGWRVNRIKVDGGCYEVYAINAQGERVEAYFHPQTLEPVPTKAR
ncbi:MAG: PepSY domain-containing protein, partial [Steroidobacteraceae bacterium]|nr:PepSY domain-containing protein [Steroidobacteraceae bacterium]MDW8259496.1 PepSY domain-containing protein [Gammaproteobacteria bacterium]